MRILDKYMFYSIFRGSVATLFSLVLILLFFKFLEELNDLNQGNYNLTEMIKYLALLIPSYFNSFVVLSLLIGTIFSIGQLNANKELQIFLTGSISKNELILKSLKYGFIIACSLIALFEAFSPQTYKLANQIKDDAVGNQKFKKLDNFWIRRNGQIISLSKNEPNKNSIRIFNIKNNTLRSYLYSDDVSEDEFGFFSDKNTKIIFNEIDGYLYPERTININDFRVDFSKDQLISLDQDAKTLSIFELIKFLIFSIENQTDFDLYLIELVSRLIRPFTLLGMVLLALPFIFDMRRSISIGKRIFVGISIGIITHLLTKIFTMIGLKFSEMVIFGPIIPTAIMLIIGIIVFRLNLNN